jgi:hypothetical protein
MPQTTASIRSRLTTPSARGLALVLIAVVLAVFGPSCRYGFVFWDDYANIVLNPHLQRASWRLADLGWIFSLDQNLRFMPVSWLVHLAICSLFGPAPGPYHFALVALHTGNCVVLFVLARQVLSQGARMSPARDVIAFLASAFWGLNPLRVEPATWCTALHYPIATLLALGSFHFYLKSVRHECLQWRPWLLSAGLGGLAACSYPTALGYAVALPLIDQIFFPALAAKRWRPREPGFASYWLSRTGYLLPSIMVALTTIHTRFHPTGIYGEVISQTQAPLPLRLLHGVSNWATIQFHQFWPTNLTPAHFPLAELPTLWTYVPLLFGLVVAAGLALYRKAYGALALLAASGAIAAPMLGFTESPTAVVDRYTYLPNAFLALLLAGILARFWPQRGGQARVCLGGGLLCLALLALQSRQQLRIWTNSTTFFTALERAPEVQARPSAKIHIFTLAAEQALYNGQPADALRIYDVLVRLVPNDHRLWLNRGAALHFLGRDTEALESLRHADGLKTDPLTLELIQLLEPKAPIPGNNAEGPSR